MLLGSLGGGIGLLVGVSVFGSAAPVASLLLAAGSFGAGVFIGRGRRGYVCAEPDCAASIERGNTVCPGCGRSIAGEIPHANDRLEAAERLSDDRESHPPA